MKQQLIDKYEGYVKNLERELETHFVFINDRDYETGRIAIRIYTEVITDLKMLPDTI